MDIPDRAQEYLRQFTSATETLKKRHDSVQVLVAQGIRELRDHWKANGSPLYKPIESASLPLPLTIETFLDRFYLSRIGMRMLTGQHIALCQAHFDPSSAPKDYVGIICTNTHVGDIAQDAIDNVRFICSEYFSLYAAPEVQVIGTTEVEFMYVPAHLHHMLFELLKNSLRAVVERYGPDAGEFPPVKLTIVQGKEDITISKSLNSFRVH